MSNLDEIGPVVMKKKIFFNFVNVFKLFCNYLPLENDGVLHLNKLEFPLPKDACSYMVEILPIRRKTSSINQPKDAMCQVWLKLTQWFWRKRFLNFVHCILAILLSSPLGKSCDPSLEEI